MWFPYIPLPVSKDDFNDTELGIVKRPFLNIYLEFPESHIPTLALVDSGADNSVFDIEFLKDAGIDISKLKKNTAGGAGNTIVEYYRHPVTIYINNEKYNNIKINLNPSFCNMEKRSQLWRRKPLKGLNLLGQKDFFSEFNILFDKQRNRFKVSISEKKDPSAIQQSVGVKKY